MRYLLIPMLALLLLLPAIPAAAMNPEILELWLSDSSVDWREQGQPVGEDFVAGGYSADDCAKVRSHIKTYGKPIAMLYGVLRNPKVRARPCIGYVAMTTATFEELVATFDTLVTENEALRQRLRALGEDP